MIHLIYVSTATKLMNQADLRFLLTQSRARNAKENITGMLLYDKGSFIQVLEGEPSAVEKIYRTILQDERNKDNVLLAKETISERDFPDWSMGFYDLGEMDSSMIPGYSNFMNEADKNSVIDLPIAKELLFHFKQ